MTAIQAERRPTRGGVQESFAGSEISLRDPLPAPIVSELSRFAARCIEEAVSSAQPMFWEARAQQFEDARPRPGDYVGASTPADLADRDARLAQTAEACRMHADFLRRYPAPLTADESGLVAALMGGE